MRVTYDDGMQAIVMDLKDALAPNAGDGGSDDRAEAVALALGRLLEHLAHKGVLTFDEAVDITQPQGRVELGDELKGMDEL